MIFVRIVSAGLGAVSIAAAVLMLFALNPATPKLFSVSPVLAAGLDRRAEALAKRGGSENLDAAVAASQEALKHSPYDTTALLRLAFIDVQRDEELGPEGVDALRESYRRVPFDRTVSLWRIQFALEVWDRLPIDLRRSVQAEVFTTASEAGHRWPLMTRFENVRNPAGRVVANLWGARVLRQIRAVSGKSTFDVKR